MAYLPTQPIRHRTLGQPCLNSPEKFPADPFLPHPLLKNPHLQTLLGPLLNPLQRPLTFRPESLPTPDGDQLFLHHLDPTPRLRSRARVLILHGLEGSHRSHSVTGLAHPLATLGHPVTVMEFRGCSGHPVTRPRLYHLGETTDLDHIVKHLTNPDNPQATEALFLVGISLGGNVVAKWLGENGHRTPPQIQAAAVIAPPFEPLLSGPQIDRVAHGRYTRHFLKSLIPKALAVADQFPGLINPEKFRHATTLRQFDDHATAPLHGFKDAPDYWKKSGCGQFLPHIRTPLLLIASEDDPFNPPESLPHKITSSSPHLHPLFTKHGGHLGFQSPTPPWWPARQITRFFRNQAER